MKVANRIYLGFATVVVVLLVVAVLNAISLGRSTELIRDNVAANRTATAVLAIERDTARLRQAVMGRLFRGADVERQAQDLYQRIVTRLERLQNDDLSAHQQRIVDRMGQLVREYWDDFDRARQVDESLAALGRGELGEVVAALRERLNALIKNASAAGDAGAVRAAVAVKDDLTRTRLALVQYADSRTAPAREHARQQLAALELSLDDMVERLRGTPFFDQAYPVEQALPTLGNLFAGLLTLGERFETLHEDRMGPVATEIGYLAEQLNEETDRGLESLARLAGIENRRTALGTIALSIFVALLAGLLAAATARRVTRPLTAMTATIVRLTGGERDVPIPATGARDEIGDLARAAADIRTLVTRTEDQRWIKTGLAKLARNLQEATDTRELARQALHVLAPMLESGYGAYFAFDQAGALDLASGYGLDPQAPRQRFAMGEGLVGQCAESREALYLERVPAGHARIRSAVIDGEALYLALVPVVHRRSLYGVLELATLQPLDERRRALLQEAVPLLALHQESLYRHQRTSELLEQTQRQAEELQASEEEMRTQSEELQAANERLLEQKHDLERTTREAERTAEQLAQANRHKSDFLANMSHELRTPLNSLLILAKDLAADEDGNLNPEQVESARVIHDSGRHLLGLINDILDLAKVEAGKLEAKHEAVDLADVLDVIRRRFAPAARDKGLGLTVECAADLPARGCSDRGKLEQILQNLVANAIKYTEHGAITIHAAAEHVPPGAAPRVAITVSDSGPGIPEAHRELIFRAFEQASGAGAGTRGGTGLGLAIARRFARLLGGDVELHSELGRGSRFILHLPLPHSAAAEAGTDPAPATAPAAPALAAESGGTIVVIEDDADFAAILCRHVEAQGFTCVSAQRGDSGVEAVRRERPVGVLLDLGLPDMDGWQVMDALKRDPATAGVPVHVVAASQERGRGLAEGAVGFATKPVTGEQIGEALARIVAARAGGRQRVLLVDPDPTARSAVATLLRGRGIDSVAVAGTGEALAALAQNGFRGLVTELDLPDGDAPALLEQVGERGLHLPPVIVLADHEPSGEQAVRLREYTDAVVLKGERAHQRLLDEVELFLHSVGRSRRPEPAPGAREPAFSGKTVLVVDDDMRNTFALSKVLRARGLKVLMAQNGRKALDQLRQAGSVDAVLMDVMMPEMDGYEAIRTIRANPAWSGLPIIALTAKAMRGDRERCLAAGASDYLAKPVDTDELLARLRTWL